MKKGKTLTLAAFSAITLGVAAISLSSFGYAGINSLVHADEEPNMLTLDKSSARNTSTSKVTGTTAKGNTVDFSYNRFDTRPGTTDYNNCMCFYKVSDGVGGYIKNDTALYGVESIRIYGYSTADPTPTTLATAPFYIYYGYEPIDVSTENSARVEITSGSYTFEDGLEPSYIAIEVRATYDLCVSKVEILYKCEPVQGTSADVTGPAYKYDYVGKEFTTAGGTKVPYNITEQAPWAHSDALDGDGSNAVIRYTHSTYTPSTKTWVTTGNDFLDFKPLSGETFPESATRKIITATFTLNVEDGGTGWGGKACDLYFGVNGNSSTLLHSRVLVTNVLTSTQGWESYDKIVSIVDADTDEDMTGKSIADKKVSVTFDATSVSEIKSIEFGTSCKGLTFTFEDITFKSTVCGHKEYTSVSRDTAYQYEGAGTYLVCSTCSEVLPTSGEVTTQAPWLRMKAAVTSSSTITDNGDSTYTTTTGGWDNVVTYTFPSDLAGRTQLALTLQSPSQWNNYIYVANESGNQFVTASAKLNWSSNALLTAVYGENGNSLGYDSSTYSINSAIGSNKFTMIFDLTKASGTIAGQTLRIICYDAGTYYVSADLRTPCDHTTTEEFSNGINCGTRCTACGTVISGYVDSVAASIPSGHDDAFSVENGVTFDSRTDCLHTTTTQHTNSSEMGWAVNYKVYYKGLVKNAIAAGKPLISLHVYIKAATNYNIRLGWGVGNNTSGAQADHYNDPVTMVGSSIVTDNSTITDESGNSAKLIANQWRVITLDVSATDFASIEDLFITCNFDVNKTYVPLETYVSGVSCAAKAA